MNAEDRFAPFHIRHKNVDLPVKAAGTHQRRIQNIRTVRCRHHDNAGIGIEAVHLHKQLVKGLLAFIMTAAQTCAAMAAHRVNFINKDDTRGISLSLRKQIAHAGRAHTHIKLHKIRTRDREERNARLPCHRFGKKRFSRARPADQQHALRDPCAHIGILFRIL